MNFLAIPGSTEPRLEKAFHAEDVRRALQSRPEIGAKDLQAHLVQLLYWGDIDAIRVLVACPRVDVNASIDEYRNRLLHVACHMRSLAMVEVLLRERRKDIVVDAPNRYGLTPLGDVITQRNTPLVRLLLRNGANPRPIIRNDRLYYPQCRAYLHDVVLNESRLVIRRMVFRWSMAVRVIPRGARRLSVATGPNKSCVCA